MDSKLMIDWLDDHGCSNHGCVVRWSKRTVGTNAICSCMRDTPYYERDRVLQYHKRLRDERIAELEAQLAAVRAKLKACLKFSRKQADIIEQASTLPTYLCEFPDIGKMGAAVRKRDLDAALAGEEDGSKMSDRMSVVAAPNIDIIEEDGE